MLGAYDFKNASERLIIGLSMVPRGEVGLIVASIGFSVIPFISSCFCCFGIDDHGQQFYCPLIIIR